MKRFGLVVLLLAVAVVAFGAGVAVKEKLAFPWLHKSERERLNAPCGKTELEWRCLGARIDNRPVALTRRFQIVAYRLQPKPDRIVVGAEVALKRGIPPLNPKKHDMGRILSDLSEAVRNTASKTVGPLDENFTSCRVELYYQGKLASKRDASGFTLVRKP